MRARSWIATVTGGALVATIGLVSSGVVTSAEAGTTFVAGQPTVVSAGTLTLSTKSYPGTVTYSMGATGAVENLSTAKDKCSLSTGGNTQYLGFTSSASSSKNAPSYYNNGVGVLSGNKTTGTACGQVNADAGESLTLTLNRTVPGPLATVFGAARANSANLDINLAGNAVIQADFYRDGLRIGGAEMQSGFSAPQQTYYPTDQLFICNFDSNSGPQSGYNNNCLWNILPLSTTAYTAPFNTPGGSDPNVVGNSPAPGALDWDYVTLTAKVGQFTLQGGGQWPAGTAGSLGSQFFLESVSDGSLGCDSNQFASASAPDGSTFTAVDVTRQQNANPSEACVPVPYSLSAGGQVTFHKPLTQDPGAPQDSAQFWVNLTRVQTTASFPITAIKSDWEDGATPQPITFCPAGVYDPATQAINYSIVSTLDQSALPGIQYACEYHTAAALQADGSLQIVDSIYLTGDWKASY